MAAASRQPDGKERGQPQQGGRLHRGIPAGFASEYPAGINWNPHLRCSQLMREKPLVAQFG